jgi:hypothetical protein
MSMSCFRNKPRGRVLQASLATPPLLACLAAGPAYANCVNPTGKEADMFYNAAIHAYQFCNGTVWKLAGQVYGGSSSGNGYFVLSKSTWNGNLGGGFGAGADALCLTELTTNTGWMGYATASGNGQLIAWKVHAFICEGGGFWGTCGALVPNTTYYFAYAGDSSKGGASFTTDSNGLGPNDSADWSGASYFGENYSYWTNEGYNSGTQWSNAAQSSLAGCGSDELWDQGTSGYNGITGNSANTDFARWEISSTVACNNTENLICIVNP